MNSKDIRALFEAEFSPLSSKFVVHELSIAEARTSLDEHVANPGIYVFWHALRGAIKVGRSFSNSRKRALEHIPANTCGCMQALETDCDARLLLFNLRNQADAHWAAALEVFLEQRFITGSSVASARIRRAQQCVAADRRENAAPAERWRWAIKEKSLDAH